jgi:hypothetical protein
MYNYYYKKKMFHKYIDNNNEFTTHVNILIRERYNYFVNGTFEGKSD